MMSGTICILSSTRLDNQKLNKINMGVSFVSTVISFSATYLFAEVTLSFDTCWQQFNNKTGNFLKSTSLTESASTLEIQRDQKVGCPDRDTGRVMYSSIMLACIAATIVAASAVTSSCIAYFRGARCPFYCYEEEKQLKIFCERKQRARQSMISGLQMQEVLLSSLHSQMILSAFSGKQQSQLSTPSSPTSYLQYTMPTIGELEAETISFSGQDGNESLGV